MRERLYCRAGLFDPPEHRLDLESLEKTEWSPTFERLMRNRLLMGALRYGTMAHKRKAMKSKWDLIGAIKKKVELYDKTGNTEYLVDMANYCLLAYEFDGHPLKHFHALDDHHEHCKLK